MISIKQFSKFKSFITMGDNALLSSIMKAPRNPGYKSEIIPWSKMNSKSLYSNWMFDSSLLDSWYNFKLGSIPQMMPIEHSLEI